MLLKIHIHKSLNNRLKGIILVFVALLQLTIGKGTNFDNYTVNNGMSNNYVDCIFQDHEGWIWIGTGMGIERFDGLRFKEYNLFINDTTQKEGLLIRHFFQDKNHTLYVCYEEYGLAYYNRDFDRFESMKMIEPCLKNNTTAKNVTEDDNGNLWIATKQGVLKYNPTNHTVKSFTKNNNSTLSLSDNYVRKISIDHNGKLWIGTRNGLDYLDPETENIIHFSGEYNGLQDDILDIWIDNKQMKWIGTANCGIIIIDSNNAAFQPFIPDKMEPRSYKVNAIYQKSDGDFWIGTRGGLYIYNELSKSTRHYVNNELEENSIVHTSIISVIEDNKGDMWIGTRGGMSHFSQEKQGFSHIRSIPGNNNYMNNSEIYYIWIDPQENIWLGTENGGINIYNKQKEQFEYITTKNGLSSNCIKSILPLDANNILIGTFKGGLNLYNRLTKNTMLFQHDPNNTSSISSDIIWDMASDKHGKIWIGTAEGLDLFNYKNLIFSHYDEFDDMQGVRWIFVDNNDDIWLGGSQVTKIYRPGTGVIKTFDLKANGVFEDSNNRYWFTTGDRGIILCDKYRGVLKEYNENSGLASKLTYCIQKDDSGNLWISTANGLSCFDPVDEKIKNYSLSDGLQSNQFYPKASYKSSNGELFFGGINGLTAFYPKNIFENQFAPPVYITDFKIFNQSIKISNDKNAILKKSITETKVLHIPYKYNVISFEFAALNYTNSDENKYKYILQGFDHDWIQASKNRSTTYTNLNPGEYTFRVIGSTNNDVWNLQGTSLMIYIEPPYYMTVWFITLMTIIVLAIVYVIFRFIKYRKELKKELEFEKERAKNLHELDAYKLNFFTNISHEIKTPLTLIISPLKRLIQLNSLHPKALEDLELIERNANQLLKLITQLLDHRKLEEGKLKIELKRGDIVSFCQSIFYSFIDIMNEKNISYSFKSVQNEIIINFDPNKLKHILNNIVSNAIKYNKPSGQINFLLHMVIEPKKPNGIEHDRFIKIVVEDTGIGISQSELDKIFTRYYSAAPTNEDINTGIGLAFTKELIEMHQGKIFVKSTVGKGSKFTILLPLIEDTASINVIDQFDKIRVKEYIRSKEFEKQQHDKKIILIIDDNTDILSFIKSHFIEQYLIFISQNGKDGFEIATEAIPDIIISDIMLPDIDGRDLCAKIKKDERTSHIPVILLSVLSSEDNILDGLDKGADDYIPKPFDIMLLQKKVENILLSRDALKEKYSKEITLIPTNYKVKSPDEKFLKKVLNYIEKNIDAADLDIDQFAREMGVSRMQLYRKISALTNMSVKECITDIRLKRAAQILTQDKMNISEVAYSVGFNDLSYFGKCFKNKFGTSPSDYMKKHLESKENPW